MQIPNVQTDIDTIRVVVSLGQMWLVGGAMSWAMYTTQQSVLKDAIVTPNARLTYILHRWRNASLSKSRIQPASILSDHITSVPKIPNVQTAIDTIRVMSLGQMSLVAAAMSWAMYKTREPVLKDAIVMPNARLMSILHQRRNASLSKSGIQPAQELGDHSTSVPNTDKWQLITTGTSKNLMTNPSNLMSKISRLCFSYTFLNTKICAG